MRNLIHLKEINNTILSISTIKLKGSKGETIQIFNQSKSIELETDEIICLSYKIGKDEYVKKVDKIENLQFQMN